MKARGRGREGTCRSWNRAWPRGTHRTCRACPGTYPWRPWGREARHWWWASGSGRAPAPAARGRARAPAWTLTRQAMIRVRIVASAGIHRALAPSQTRRRRRRRRRRSTYDGSDRARLGRLRCWDAVGAAFITHPSTDQGRRIPLWPRPPGSARPQTLTSLLLLTTPIRVSWLE